MIDRSHCSVPCTDIDELNIPKRKHAIPNYSLHRPLSQMFYWVIEMKLIMIEDLLDCLGLSFRFDGIRNLMLVGHLHGLHSLCWKFGVENQSIERGEVQTGILLSKDLLLSFIV